MPVMCIECNEVKHAYRINGVTFSKKRLSELFPLWESNTESLWRYLFLMPFFAETKTVEEAPTDTGKYAIFKAKRLLKAMKLDKDAFGPFMAVAAEAGGIKDNNMMHAIVSQSHDHTCDCGVKKSPQNWDGNVVDIRSYTRH